MATATDTWLSHVMKWQANDDTLSVTLEQGACQQDLTDYLSELYVTLKSYPSITVALQSVPKVGQLLGRLTLFPRLLLETGTFRALMRCILTFYVDTPMCPVEFRSRKWVMSQVQQMVCQVDDKLSSSFLLNIGGHKLGDFHAVCAKNICESMVRGLQKPDMRSCDDDLVLCDKCRVCLSLRHITVFDYLLTSLVRRLVTSTAINGPVEKLLHDIEETQKHPYTAEHPVVPLSYKLQVLLWSTLLHSLEHEVLDFIEKSSQSVILCSNERLLCRHLVRACAEEPHIYHTVFTLLENLVLESAGSWTLICVTHTLHTGVRQSINKDYTDCLLLTKQYDLPLQPLINLLSVAPKDLPPNYVDNHMELIDRVLSKLLHNADPSLEKNLFCVMVQYLDWYTTALCYSFICHKKVFSCSLRIVSIFHRLNQAQDTTTDEVQLVADVMESLRCLYSKQNLTLIDIDCALAPVVPIVSRSCEKLITDPLLGQLVLIFCLLSAGGHKVIKGVLNMICGKSSLLHDQVESVLKAVALIQNVKLPTLQISKDMNEHIIAMANECSEDGLPSAGMLQDYISVLFK